MGKAGHEPRVALVHDHLVQDGGAERVLRTLMRMYPKAPVYTLLYDPRKMGREFRRADIRTSGWQRVPGATRFYKALLPFIDGAFRHFDLSGYDLVISSSSGFAKSVRTGPGTLHVCYCHTPIRYLWSDSERYIRELPYPDAVKSLIRLIRPRLRAADLRAAEGVDTFVANSEYVAKRIKRYYGRTSTVINPPVATDQFKPRAAKDDYYLIASRLEPYKRVDLAIAVANKLELPLTIMGDGTDRDRLEELAGPTVRFLGRVSDAERSKVFAEARAFLNPQDEDFGITAVEALASGTPVIAYGKGGATEILNAQTGILFDRQTADALAGAIRKFERRRFDRRALVARSREFSEAKFIRRLRRFVDTTYQRHRSG